VAVVGALTVLACVAPAAMADTETGPINVEISSSATAGIVFDSTTNTWAPDGTSDPAILNATDLSDSSVTAAANVTVITTSTAQTGTASADDGDIDLKADPGDSTISVEFTPAATTGVITIDTPTVTFNEGDFNGPVRLGEDTSIPSQDTEFGSTVDGAHSLTVDEAEFFADVGGTAPLTSLSATGQAWLLNSLDVTTTSSQHYGAVAGDASSVFTSTGSANAANITFGAVTDNGTLVTHTDGTTAFDGQVDGNFTAITTRGYSSPSAGVTEIGTSSISSTNASSISFDNPVQLGADVTVAASGGYYGASGGTVTFSSTLDSASNTSHSLTDTHPDDVSLDRAVGATAALSSVDLNTATTHGNVTTAGAQTYAAMVLAGSPTLKSTGSWAITFTGQVTGPDQDSLTTDTMGATQIEAGVGGTVSGSGITSLDIKSGPATIAGTVHTSGDQTYGGAVTFGSQPLLVSDSGQIDSSHVIDLGGGNVPIQGSGSLTGAISDGSLTIGSGSTSADAPSYTLALGGDNTYVGGTTVTGTNSLVQFSSLASFGSGSLTLIHGAGLKWAQGTSTDISTTLSPIETDGAVFDTNGNDVTFATPLAEHGEPGTIVKQGAGELTLTGDETGKVPWDVKGGTLNMTGSLAGAVLVEGGAGFNLSGQANGLVTIEQSGTLSCQGGTLGDGLSNNGIANYVPAVPSGVSAAAGAGTATVSFTPGATRCSPFNGYEVTAEPGNIHASGTGSPITVSGLKGGTTYTFTVTASNVIGASAPSSASVPVTTPRLVNASISSPGAGHAYEVGQQVATRFSCTGVTSGALISCKDSGGATGGIGKLDTSIPGRHTYVVTATAGDGSTETASMPYTVSASNAFTFSKIAVHTKGLITFTLKVPDAGALRILEKAGKLTLASATRFAKGAATLRIRLSLSKRERKLLSKHSIKATVRITFTPIGGHPRTQQRSGVRLKR
jgi:hypothetical protein